MAPVRIDTPNIETYKFPKVKLDLKAKEQLLIGKRVSLLKNLDEKQNLAIASLATSAILLVGGLIAAFMVSSVLGSIMIFPSILLGTAGSLFFVMKKYLDPKQKIESDKDALRFAIFEKVMQYDTDQLEGYDLLQKAIEDRSKNPEDKKMVYIAVRQLKRHVNKLIFKKRQFENEIEKKYRNFLERLQVDKNSKIANLRGVFGLATREAQIFQINKEFDDRLKVLNGWKERSNQKLTQEYKTAIEDLNLRYDSILSNLGELKGLAYYKNLFWQKIS